MKIKNLVPLLLMFALTAALPACAQDAGGPPSGAPPDASGGPSPDQPDAKAPAKKGGAKKKGFKKMSVKKGAAKASGAKAAQPAAKGAAAKTAVKKEASEYRFTATESGNTGSSYRFNSKTGESKKDEVKKPVAKPGAKGKTAAVPDGVALPTVSPEQLAAQSQTAVSPQKPASASTGKTLKPETAISVMSDDGTRKPTAEELSMLEGRPAQPKAPAAVLHKTKKPKLKKIKKSLAASSKPVVASNAPAGDSATVSSAQQTGAPGDQPPVMEKAPATATLPAQTPQ